MNGIGKIPDRQNYITCSPSALNQFVECPSIYEWSYIKGHKKETASMELGTMIHEALLEPEVFESKYVFLPGDMQSFSADELKELCALNSLPVSGTKLVLAKRLKEALPEFDCYDLFAERSTDKMVLSEKQTLMIKTIVENAKKTRMYKAVLEHGVNEQLCYFTHNSGVVVPFKTDSVLMTEKFCCVLDVKTTFDISMRAFDRENYDMGRDIQAALYIEGIEKVFNRKVDAFCWLAVETSAPYRVVEIAPDDAMIEAGKTRANIYLKDFKARHEANDWSMRETGLQTTTLQSWAWDKINDLEMKHGN